MHFAPDNDRDNAIYLDLVGQLRKLAGPVLIGPSVFISRPFPLCRHVIIFSLISGISACHQLSDQLSACYRQGRKYATLSGNWRSFAP